MEEKYIRIDLITEKISKMKLRFLIVVIIVHLCGCKTKDTFIDKLNNNYINYIKSDASYENGLRNYLDDNINHITSLRKNFFKLINKKNIERANLIENLDKSSNNLYNGFLQIDSTVYIYDYFILQDSSDFKKMNIKAFINDKMRYGTESCVLSKMMDNDLEDLLDDNITSNFHYIVYTTSIDDENFKVHSLKDICR